MNISVSVEELKAYEKKCHSWITAYLERDFSFNLLSREDMNKTDMSKFLQSEYKRLDDMLKEEPFPKLIPTV